MEDEKFNKDLDELFRLFKKLVETQSLDDVPGVDGMMLKQFQFFFSNYENMRGQIGEQLQGQFGEPVKQMVSDLVKQLKNQLGEDEFIVVEDIQPEIQIETKEITVEEIDKLLMNPDLTEDQINELLDKRANLL